MRMRHGWQRTVYLSDILIHLSVKAHVLIFILLRAILWTVKVCIHIVFSYLYVLDHVWCFVKLLASGVSDSEGLGCWRGDLRWSRLILPCVNQGKGVTNIMTSRGQRKSSTLVDGDDTNLEMARSDPSGALCVEGCPYDGEHKAKDMIRCCQCAAWVHINCINKTEEYVPGVWPCFRCRQIPSKLETMQEMISDLVKTVNNLNNNKDKIKQENEKVKCLLKERDDKLEGIIRENTELRGRIATVSNNASADHWQKFTPTTGNSLGRK